MKKYILGAFAFLLAISFSAFIPSTNSPKMLDREFENWYSVEDNEITGVYDHNKKQSQLTPTAPCPDNGDIVCLVGTNQTLSMSQQIDPGEYDEDQLIAFEEE